MGLKPLVIILLLASPLRASFIVYERAGMLHLVTDNLKNSVAITELSPAFRCEGSNSRIAITEDKDGFEVECCIDIANTWIWRYVSLLQRRDGSILITQWTSYCPELPTAEMYPDYHSFVRRSSSASFIATTFSRLGLNENVPTAHQIHVYLHGEPRKKVSQAAAQLVADLDSGDWRVRRRAAEKLLLEHHAELKEIRATYLTVEQRKVIDRLIVPLVVKGSDELMELLWAETERD